MASGITRGCRLLLKSVFLLLKLTCAAGLICLVSLEIAEFIAGELITTTLYLSDPPNPKVSLCNSFFVPHSAWNDSMSSREVFGSHRRSTNELILYFDSVAEDGENPTLTRIGDQVHYTLPNRQDITERGMHVTYCHALTGGPRTRAASSHQLNVARRSVSNTASVMLHTGALPRTARYLDSPVTLTQYALRSNVVEAVVGVAWSEYRRVSRSDAPCVEAADVWSCPERCRLARAARQVNCVPFFLLDMLPDLLDSSSLGADSMRTCETLDEFMAFHGRFHETPDDCQCPRSTCAMTSVSLEVSPRRDASWDDMELRTLLLFRRQGVVRTTEKPAMTWTSFLADFGGNLGLLLGVSALTVVEMLQQLLERVGPGEAPGSARSVRSGFSARNIRLGVRGLGSVGGAGDPQARSDIGGRPRHLLGPNLMVAPGPEVPPFFVEGPETPGEIPGSRRGSGVFTLTRKLT